MADVNDLKYLRLAYDYAMESHDLSTQNGAVLVEPPHRGGNVVSFGWNDIHPASRTPQRQQRPLKYAWTEHAERMAICLAAKWGKPTKGLWMYACWLACADCGRAIVLAGIRRVVRHKIPQHAGRPDWAESIAVADQMFAEAGVEVVTIEERLGVRFRFNGQEIEA